MVSSLPSGGRVPVAKGAIVRCKGDSMPVVTLEHVYPATFLRAPMSALVLERPKLEGSRGELGLLKVEYGPASGIETRWICAFVGKSVAFHTNPGELVRDGERVLHVRRTKPSDVLRDPQRDDIAGVYVNEWRITGPEVCDARQREDFLASVHARWRVLKRARLR